MCVTMLRPFLAPTLALSAALLLLPTTRACSQENQSAAVRAYNVAAALQNNAFYPRAAALWSDFLQK